MKKKIDQLRDLMLSERWDEALSLASKFEDLGDHAKEIRMAHGANTSPSITQDWHQRPYDALQALLFRRSDALGRGIVIHQEIRKNRRPNDTASK